MDGPLSINRRAFVALAGSAALAGRAGAAPAPFKRIAVDAAATLGPIKDLQGVNRGPAADWAYPDLTAAYRDLRVSLVRTHDFYGAFDLDSRYTRKGDPQTGAERVPVDTLTRIFPDPAADPDRAASYDFAATDRAVRAILAAGAVPYFRVGRSWGADTTPPDPVRYARVAARVARHYHDGWADGFDARIRYWEIWNEPDFPAPFWSGTPEQYYALYAHTARALKAVNPAFRVGGPGKAWTLHEDAYRTAFLQRCRADGLPLDFYSWHSYTNASANPYDLVEIARTIRALLDANGFRAAESHVSEWAFGAGVPPLSPLADAAYRAAGLVYMQDAPLSASMLYHGQALFEHDGRYTKAAHAVKAVGQMLDTPVRLACTGADRFGYAVLAGRSAANDRVRILVANYQTPAESPLARPFAVPADLPPETKAFLGQMVSQIPHDAFLPFTPHADPANRRYQLTVANLGWRGAARITRRRLDADHDLAVVGSEVMDAGALALAQALPAPGIELIDIVRA